MTDDFHIKARDIALADLRHCQMVVEQLREEILRHEAKEQINKWQIDALTRENDKQAAEIERLKGKIKEAKELFEALALQPEPICIGNHDDDKDYRYCDCGGEAIRQAIDKEA